MSITFFFVFLAPIFFVCLVSYFKQHVQIWKPFIAFLYFFLVYFVFFNFPAESSFELQVHEIIDFFRSKNGRLVC